MQEFKAEVINIVYNNPENGYTIARIRTSQYPGLVTICGYLGSIAPGEMLKIKGFWKEHPKYGRQISVQDFEQLFPASINGIRRYLSSHLIKGIGPVMAQRLIDKFGVRVLEIIDKEPERLLEVEGIGPKKKEMIVRSWAQQREIRALMLFLQSHEVAPTFATRIFKKYGQESVKKLKENPYDLAYDIQGIGFKTADKMALKLGFALDSEQRLQAAISYTLFKLSEQGHLFYPEEELVKKVLDILGDIDGNLILKALDDLLERKRIFKEDLPQQGVKQAVYLTYFYRLEKEISSRLYHLYTHPAAISETKVSQILPKIEARERLTLTPEQRQAVLGACTNKVFVITGGPGTGKTTITRMIVHIFNQLGLKVKLAAPTGRAAKRLSEATGGEARTIHRLLGATPQGQLVHNEENKLAVDVLIVDEVSMLDGPLCLNLLRALPLTCRLVLIGDVHQLPSVGPGNILADILRSEAIPVVKLTTIFRQAMESMIVVNAHRINEGKFPIKCSKPAPDADFYWVEQEDLVRVQELIIRMVCERMPEVYGLNPLRDVQVLTPMHKGDVGTNELNKLLQARLNPQSQELKRGQRIFRVGDRVMQIRNNYEKEVFNGDLGWIKEIDLEEGQVVVDYEDHLVKYYFDELDELTLAYAVSVHKSQGSEYPAIIMPVVTQHFMLLQRNLIYTGLTRARRLAILIGTKKALAIALRNINAGKRYTHLQFRLQEVFNSLSVRDYS
jgi:exodeoxyribonuclease V alpha subunit